MRKFIILLVLLQCGTISFGQSTDYHWYKGEKQHLEVNPDKIFMYIREGTEANVQQAIPANYRAFQKANEHSRLQQSGYPEGSWSVVESPDIWGTDFSDDPNIIYTAPVYDFENEDGVLSHLFRVKLKDLGDESTLRNLAGQHQCVVMDQNEFMPLWFTLACTKESTGHSLDMANLFYETGDFAAAEPDIMFNNLLQCVNDGFFANQWGLDNDGSTGTLDMDVKACEAWQISNGSNNVAVAVLDHGIELDHPDMTNLHCTSYDAFSGTSPSTIHGNHGTACAGIVGADHDNALGVSGLAPGCELMSVSTQLLLNAGAPAELADGINFAWTHGAAVISNSWGHNGLASAMIDDAIDDALALGRNGLGTVMVFATGNSNNTVIYPASSNDAILSVGAASPCGERKSTSSCDGETWWGSCFGSELDVIAPGVLIPTTDRQGSAGYSSTDYTQNFNGTSSATPHAAALAGLILSINPQLTQAQVVDIIECSAQKVGSYAYATTGGRPNGTWHQEAGYGMIDAEAALIKAQTMCTGTLDLYSRDGFDDLGQEPNNETQYAWTSKDIWIRNQPDGLVNEEHQDPEFSSTNDPNQLNYVYVRVRNNSCIASSGTEELTVHWGKANTALSWPANWNGLNYLDPPTNNALAGDEIGTVVIPVIPPGGSTVLEFAWNPPNPANYSGINANPWHFCLLSRIEAAGDPITNHTNIGTFVRANNNVSWRNLTVIDNIAGFAGVGCPGFVESISETVAINNPTDEEQFYDVEFVVPKEELKHPITDEGNVMIVMDDGLYERWKAGGKRAVGVAEIRYPNMSETGIANNRINAHAPINISPNHVFLATEPVACFQRVKLYPGEVKTASTYITYPENPVSEVDEFNYHVIQKQSGTGKILGGVSYFIKKPPCDLNVSAGNDRSIGKGCSVDLTGTPEEACTAYWWQNESGQILANSRIYNVAPQSTSTYTLKVVSSKGCIYHDDVNLNVSNQFCKQVYSFEKLGPNPVVDVLKYAIHVAERGDTSADGPGNGNGNDNDYGNGNGNDYDDQYLSAPSLEPIYDEQRMFIQIAKSDGTYTKLERVNGMLGQSIDVSYYPRGSYVVSLQVQGVYYDSKTIIFH